MSHISLVGQTGRLFCLTGVKRLHQGQESNHPEPCLSKTFATVHNFISNQRHGVKHHILLEFESASGLLHFGFQKGLAYGLHFAWTRLAGADVSLE